MRVSWSLAFHLSAKLRASMSRSSLSSDRLHVGGQAGRPDVDGIAEREPHAGGPEIGHGILHCGALLGPVVWMQQSLKA